MKTKSEIKDKIIKIADEIDLLQEGIDTTHGNDKIMFGMAKNAAKKQIEILTWVLNEAIVSEENKCELCGKTEYKIVDGLCIYCKALNSTA